MTDVEPLWPPDPGDEPQHNKGNGQAEPPGDGTRPKAQTNGHRAGASKRKAKSRPAWLTDAQLDKYGEPRPNLYNAMLALRGNPALANTIAYDEMLRCPVLDGASVFANTQVSNLAEELYAI